MSEKFKNTQDIEVGNSEAYERVRWLSEQFDRYHEYWKPDINRAVRNARMYWHVNFGQWPAYVVEILRNQGRRPPSFPIIPDKIETLVGSFLANSFEMKIEPSNGKLDTLSMNVYDIIIDMGRRMDWETSEIMCLLDSFIMMGGERMVIRGASHNDPFGLIAWEHIDPTHTFANPCFKSPYMDKLTDYFEYRYMTATEIMQEPLFSSKSEHLKDLYEREKREGIDYGQNQGAVPVYDTPEDKWHDKHRVITFHHVEENRDDYEYDLINHCFFPETGYKMGSDEDRQVKIAYIQKMGLGQHDITYMPKTKRVKKVETIAPTIDREMFLQSGKDIIQTNNCNLYLNGIWYKGQWQGIVDRLYDIQVAYNKGKMNLQDIQSRSAKGAFLLDRALSGGDVALELEIEQKWNDPAARIWVDEGSTSKLPGGGIVPLPSSNSTPDMYNEPQQYLDLADRFSKVPAAQDSRSESGKESGVLFRHKLEVGMIGQKYLMKSYERHKKAKIIATIQQMKITLAGIPRTFEKIGTKEKFAINQPATNFVTGQPVILNDISLLPEMSITLTPSKNGLNIRHILRSQYAEALEALDDPRFGLLKVTLTGLILATQEMPEEDKEEVKAAVKLLKMQEALAVAKNVYGLKGEVAQLVESLKKAGLAGGEMAGVSPDAMVQQQISESGVQLDEEAMKAGTELQGIVA